MKTIFSLLTVCGLLAMPVYAGTQTENYGIPVFNVRSNPAVQCTRSRSYSTSRDHYNDSPICLARSALRPEAHAIELSFAPLWSPFAPRK
jgi:hypothetical protein